MNKLIICRGIPASGKSTWAKNWVAEDPTHRARFNWDDARNMMGPYWVPERENSGILKDLRTTFLETAMRLSWDIVIDNMNLNPKELAYYRDLVKNHNNLNPNNQYKVETKDFYTPVDVCIERDSKRENPIGEKVIRDIWRKYKQDIWLRESEAKINSLKTYDSTKPDCILVDMDGTLAFNLQGRPFYGPGTVESIQYDTPLISTVSILRAMKMTGTCKVIIVTGRDESCQEATEQWLKDYSVPFDAVLMRKEGDTRAGNVVKQDIYDENIKPLYNVLFALDDDDKCAAMYRKNGIICMQP